MLGPIVAGTVYPSHPALSRGCRAPLLTYRVLHADKLLTRFAPAEPTLVLVGYENLVR